MELSLLAERPEDWESETRALVGRTLFHQSAWLDYVTSAFPGMSAQFVRIADGAQLVGYLCALRTKRLLHGIWGSPFPGTGMYLGPMLRSDIDQAEFMRIIDEHCTRSDVAHFSLCNDHLRPGVMEALGFREHRSVTFETPLAGGEGAVWDRMRGNCRTRIRKATKGGLEAELTTDPGVADEFYALYSQVMTWKRMAPEYGVQRPRALLRHLMPANKLFAVRIRHEGRVIAAGLYPHDDHAMYFWDAGYDPEYAHLSPNELMHWAAMKAAIGSGIGVFRIGGAPQPSRFTQKFGGDLVPYVIYEKSYNAAYSSVAYVYSGLRWARASLDTLILNRMGRAAGGASDVLLALLFCAAAVA
jgi:hypothetical protein